MKLIFNFLFPILLFFSCESSLPNDKSDLNQDRSSGDYWEISQYGVGAIKTNMPITQIPKGLTVKNDGGGTSQMYLIYNDKNEQVLSIVSDTMDNLIDGIFISESKLPKTSTGVSIGSSFGDLKKEFKDLNAFGDWMTGKGVLQSKKVFFETDFEWEKTALSKAIIPEDAKITKIWILD